MANEVSITAPVTGLGAVEETLARGVKENRLLALFLLMAAAGIGAGLYAFVEGHHHAYANFREMPWGLLISGYAFFAICSTGLCLLAVLSHIFGGNRMAPLANRMVFLSIVTIVSAFFIIGLELENPWRLAIYNVISPNLNSNIWWMGTLYGMAVGFMLVEFFLIMTGRFRLALGLGVAGGLAEVMANTNLGAVFATLAARPYWYGSQLPVYFLASAFMCGAAVIILATWLSFALRGLEPDRVNMDGVRGAAKVMALVLFLLAVSMVWKFIAAFTGGSESARMSARVLLDGPLAVNFWGFEVVVGMAVPLFILIGDRFRNIQACAVAALMVLVGAFFQRYDLVVAGQMAPVFQGMVGEPAYFSYTPSLAEFLVVAGGIGIACAGVLLGERFFARVFVTNGH